MVDAARAQAGDLQISNPRPAASRILSFGHAPSVNFRCIVPRSGHGLRPSTSIAPE